MPRRMLGVEPGQSARHRAGALAPDLRIGQADAARGCRGTERRAACRLASRPACVQDSQRSAAQRRHRACRGARQPAPLRRPVKLLQRLREGDAAGPPHPRRQRAPRWALRVARSLSAARVQGAGERAARAMRCWWLLGPGASTGRRCRAWACRPCRICAACRLGGGVSWHGAAGRSRLCLRRAAIRVSITLPPRFESRLELFASRRQRRAGAACRRDAAGAPVYSAGRAACLCARLSPGDAARAALAQRCAECRRRRCWRWRWRTRATRRTCWQKLRERADGGRRSCRRRR